MARVSLVLVSVLVLVLVLVCCTRVLAQTSRASDSTDWVQAVKNAAASLNVAPPASAWTPLMSAPTTTGTQGQAQVGPTTYQSVVQSWNLPADFATRAEQTLGALVYAANEAEYIAQSVVFDDNAHTGSLTFLVVVARRDATPTDPNNPVFLAHFLITSTCAIAQQYTPVTTKDCGRCIKCLWTHHCCCHDVTTNEPRGDTPQELQTIIDRMKEDQYNWLMAHLSYSSAPFPFPTHKVVSVLEAIANYIVNAVTQAEVHHTYNDSVITAVQHNITIIRQETDAVRLEGIADAQFEDALTSISQAYGFYDDIKPYIASAKTLPKFSYEFLQRSDPTSDFTYTWIVGGMDPTSTNKLHNMYLVSSTANSLANLLNNSMVNVFRSAVLGDNGLFSGETFPVLHSPWQLNQTRIVLDILRQNAGSALVNGNQPSFVPVDGLRQYLVPINGPEDLVRLRAGLGDGVDPLSYIENAIKGFCSTWQDIANTFKTVESTSITRIIRFGFTYYHELSTVNQVSVPQAQLQQFLNMLVPSLELPTTDPKVELMLFELDFSTNVTWDRDDFLFSTADGSDKTVMVLKNGDPTTGNGNFFIVTIDASFDVAPDLLLVHKHKSILGGIFESDKDSIEDVPHVLTLQESIALQDFFTIVAMGKVAEIFGIPFQWPTIPPLNN